MTQNKICIYLKPDEKTLEEFEKQDIVSPSQTIGIHTTIHHLNYHNYFEEEKQLFSQAIRNATSKIIKIPKLEIEKYDFWENKPVIVFKKNKELEHIYNSISLRLNIGGSFIENIYANVNPNSLENVIGYNPHISLSKHPKNKIDYISMQNNIFYRIKINKEWSNEKSIKINF